MDHEEDLVRRFYACCGKTHDVQIERCSPPKPDILVFDRTVTPRRHIGIEVTRYHQKKVAGKFTRHQTEVEWEKLAREFDNQRRYHFQAGALRQLLVMLKFKDLKLPPPKDRPRFIQELLDWIGIEAQNITANTLYPKSMRIPQPASQPLVALYVHHASLVRVRVEWPRWHSNFEGGSVGILFDEISLIIDEKNRKAAGYDASHLAELQLLIVAENSSYSQAVPSQRLSKLHLQKTAELLSQKLSISPFKEVWFFSLPDWAFQLHLVV